MWERSRWDGRAPPSGAVASPPAADLDYDDLDLGAPLGATGKTTVFEARVRGSAGPDRVAVKQPDLSATLDRGTVDRFVEEAEVWAGLDDHPHVVGVVDYGTEPVPWIAMEFMDGGSLADRVPSPFREALWIALGATRAVRHAHTRGVVHHDLKPANVLFREAGDRWPVPKVADWELARRLLEADHSEDAYTPRYAAPEQLYPERYGRADRPADLFQLGVLCYELFTGEHPFGETGVAGADGPPAPPSEVADVPAELDDPLLTALARDPTDRQEDVLDLRRSLERVADAFEDGSLPPSVDHEGGAGTRGEEKAEQRRTDDGSTGTEGHASRRPKPTVRFATVREPSDWRLVEDAVRDGDLVLSHLPGDVPDATAEQVVDELRQVTEAVDGDIVQHGSDEVITTPTGHEVARTLVTEDGGEDAEFALAVVADREDVAAVEAAVRSGVIVLAHVPADASVPAEAVAEELLAVSREVQGDIVQRGERDLLVTPTRIEIARERLTE
jgi:serine/threonine protein kinase